MQPRFCYDRLVITETGMHLSVFLLGLSGGCVDTTPLWLHWDVGPVAPQGRGPCGSVCRGTGVSYSTAPWVLCVGVDTAPVTPGVWAHVVPGVSGDWGVWLCLPPVSPGDPATPRHTGTRKNLVYFSAPSYEATHALRVSHPGSSPHGTLNVKSAPGVTSVRSRRTTTRVTLKYSIPRGFGKSLPGMLRARLGRRHLKVATDADLSSDTALRATAPSRSHLPAGVPGVRPPIPRGQW